MKNFLYILVISLFIWSCNTTKEKSIYFSGKILNTNTKDILLMKKGNVIDTIPLDEQNRFSRTYEGLEAGLYVFKHGNEFQYIYFEPGDSLNLRLNIWDFDRSLVFDGKGSEKSELLIRLFLENEELVSNINNYFKLSKSKFEKKFDNDLNERLSRIREFSQNNPNLTTDFSHLIDCASRYPMYRVKELYPFVHKKLTRKTINLSKDTVFYKYRKSINLNDSILSNHYVYTNYLSSYFYNKAYTENKTYRLSDKVRESALEHIANDVKIDYLKNLLLYQEVNHIVFNNHKVNPTLINIFYERCTDNIMKNRIKQSLRIKSTLNNYEDVKDIIIVQKKRKRERKLHYLLRKNQSVLVFWNENIEQVDKIRIRFQYLINKYSSLKFVFINTDNGEVTTYQDKKEPITDYKLKYLSQIINYTIKDSPRTVIINRYGNIINNFSSIFSKSFEKDLNRLRYY